MVLGLKRKVDAEYDILNFWSSPGGPGLTVKVGTFSPKSPQGQQLVLSQHMIKWPTGLTEVSWILSQSFGLYINDTNMFMDTMTLGCSLRVYVHIHKNCQY